MTERKGVEVVDRETLDSVLGYYSVQLQSHAALVVAAFVGIFALLQVQHPSQPGVWLEAYVIGLSFSVASLFTGILYLAMRLWAYGVMVNSILMGRKTLLESVSKDTGDYLAHSKVYQYSSIFYQKEYKSRWSHWLYKHGNGKQPKIPFLLAVGGALWVVLGLVLWVALNGA